MSQRAFSYGAGVLFAAAGAACWSMAGGLVRLTEGVDAWQIVFYRSSVVLVCMLVWLGLRFGGDLWARTRDAGMNAVIAGVAIGTAGLVFIISMFYTTVASALKFALGLWLALLLNKNLPFQSFFRAVVLLPWIVPTALSAIAFWWIYDAQFSVISWALLKLGWIDKYIDFLGNPWNARVSTIVANVWRGIPFVAISLLAGLQTISPSYYEASAIDGATPWQQFRHITLPLLTPIIAVVMTFSVLFTFTDFQLIYVLTRGGPLNATHLMATLAFQRAISGGALAEGAASATLMVPVLLAAIMFSYFGLQRRAWQQGSDK